MFRRFVVLVACAIPALADAVEPSDLCTGNPCIITARTVVTGSLDFGPTTDVRLAPGALLQIGLPSDDFAEISLRAGSVVLEAGSRIHARTRVTDQMDPWRVVAIEAASGSIVVERGARVDLRGGAQSELDLSAGGDVVLAGTIDLRTKAAFAAFLDVTAGGDVTFATTLLGSARGEGSLGSSIYVQAQGGIRIEGRIDSTGHEGGELSFTSESGSVEIDGKVDVSGFRLNGGGGGEVGAGIGGTITIDAPAGDIHVRKEILGRGASAFQDYGVGAEVSMTAGGSVFVDGPIRLEGGPNGESGSLDVRAGGDFRQSSSGPILTVGTFSGPDSFAGDVDIDAGGTAVLSRIDLSATSGTGFLEVEAADIEVVGPINSDAMGSFGFAGGSIELEASEQIWVAGRIEARGRARDTTGGDIRLRAAEIEIEGEGRIDTRSDRSFSFFASVIALRATGPILIAGNVFSNDVNRIEYGTVPPVITGRVEPEPEITQIP